MTDLRAAVHDLIRLYGWSPEWQERTAYLHLEASELAEAVRGKGGDTLEESADVLITLLGLSPHRLPEIIQTAWIKVERLRWEKEHRDRTT